MLSSTPPAFAHTRARTRTLDTRTRTRSHRGARHIRRITRLPVACTLAVAHKDARARRWTDVTDVFEAFLETESGALLSVAKHFRAKLIDLLEYFRQQRKWKFIGSSILFVYDNTPRSRSLAERDRLPESIVHYLCLGSSDLWL